MKQRAAEHAVAEDGAGRDQRDRGEDDDDAVEKGQRMFERRDERVACDAASVRLFTIRKRTVHHAETSDASFNSLAAVAVLAP